MPVLLKTGPPLLIMMLSRSVRFLDNWISSAPLFFLTVFILAAEEAPVVIPPSIPKVWPSILLITWPSLPTKFIPFLTNAPEASCSWSSVAAWPETIVVPFHVLLVKPFTVPVAPLIVTGVAPPTIILVASIMLLFAPFFTVTFLNSTSSLVATLILPSSSRVSRIFLPEAKLALLSAFVRVLSEPLSTWVISVCIAESASSKLFLDLALRSTL